MLFTYKIHKNSSICPYLELIPNDEFYRRWKNAAASTLGVICINNNLITLLIEIPERLINNNVGIEVARYCINNIGNCEYFNYNKIVSCWNFEFKITNKNLLLELL